jgi:hypothetical protein
MAREPLTMDVAGARALAERIAEGKPIDEETTAPPPIEPPAGPIRQSPSTPAEDGVEVVFVHPRVLERRAQVWMYVRGPDGHLHRER